MKLNCWELKNCGRQPGGVNVSIAGICPASLETKVNGINSGTNGGRCCWVIFGTLCSDKAHGDYFEKVSKCMSCEVYKTIWREENKDGTYVPPAEILRVLSRRQPMRISTSDF